MTLTKKDPAFQHQAKGGRRVDEPLLAILYEPTHHIHMFRSAPKFLFRGTRLTRSHFGEYRGSGHTPTSIDPIVATLFAAFQRSQGEAYVLVLEKDQFEHQLGGASERTFASLELAVNIAVTPMELETRATRVVPVDTSLEILGKLGHYPDRVVYTPTQLAESLRNVGRLHPEEIGRYSDLVFEATS